MCVSVCVYVCIHVRACVFIRIHKGKLIICVLRVHVHVCVCVHLQGKVSVCVLDNVCAHGVWMCGNIVLVLCPFRRISTRTYVPTPHTHTHMPHTHTYTLTHMPPHTHTLYTRWLSWRVAWAPYSRRTTPSEASCWT